MDMQLKAAFLEHWRKYFAGAELPIVFYYTDREDDGDTLPAQSRWCVIADLAEVRKGRPIAFGAADVKCAGGRRYFGFSQVLRPNFEYFLSCGIPGKLEGERYKKSPELVTEHLKHQEPSSAPAKYIVFKRWDRLDGRDEPAAVIFFATPDVLAGLFTLANFDERDPYGVITPFGSGCSLIVDYPLRESQSPRPRVVMGLFDVSARPFVPADRLTFTVPWTKFPAMVGNMDESFLITESWKKVRARIAGGEQPTCSVS